MKTRPDFSEHRLSGERVFAGKVLDLFVDQARLPDGSEATREVARHPGAAAILPVPEDGSVLLEWQFRYPLGRHLLEIPAGKIDPGEKPEDCARRELLEETGYEAARWDFMLSTETSPGFCDEIVHLYLARELRHKGHPGCDGEFVSTEIIALKDALQMVRAGEITDSKTVIGLLWLAEFRG